MDIQRKNLRLKIKFIEHVTNNSSYILIELLHVDMTIKELL